MTIHNVSAMCPSRRRLRRDAGVVTIYDLILYLAIAGFFLIAGILTYNALTATNKDQTALTDLNSLRGNIPTFYSGGAGFGSGDLKATLLSVNAIPQDMIVGSGATAVVQNAYGGTVVITGADTKYTIEFDGVGPGGCAKLSTLNASGPGSGYLGVSVNGSALTIPVNTTSAVAACNITGSGPGAGNAIIWTFQ